VGLSLVFFSALWSLSFSMQCPGDEFRTRTFLLKRSHPSTKTIDWQTIRYGLIFTVKLMGLVHCIVLQNPRDYQWFAAWVRTHSSNGWLRNDPWSWFGFSDSLWIWALTFLSVDSCVPGDMVSLTGVVKVMNADEGSNGIIFPLWNQFSFFPRKGSAERQMHVSSLHCGQFTDKR
jgi:hypothetical protein